MIKHEQAFTTKWLRWLKANRDQLPLNALVEIKVVRPGRKTFTYSELSPKEESCLWIAKNGQLRFKQSDFDRMGTYCDVICISGAGYIVLNWVEDKKKTFYCIDINTWITHRDLGQSKVLTKEEANRINFFVGNL